MSAAVELFQDPAKSVSGIVEGAGKAVSDLGKAVDEVGRGIDTYVIKPIEKDPVQAIAMAAAAYYLGPLAAEAFGTSAAVGTGIAVGGSKTVYALSQGKEFDQALKEGAVAGLTSGAIHGAVDYFTTPAVSLDGTPPVASNDATLMDAGGGDNFQADASLSGGPDAPPPPVEVPQAPAPIQQSAPETPLGQQPVQTSPLSTYRSSSPDLSGAPSATVPSAPPSVEIPAIQPLEMSDLSIPSTDLSAGLRNVNVDGVSYTPFQPSDSYNMYGEPNYNIDYGNNPGLQPQSSPGLTNMGGGTGPTLKVSGLDQFTYGPGAGSEYVGQPANWQTEASYDSGVGKTYGQPSPDGTIGARGFTPDVAPNVYTPTQNVGELSPWEKLTRGDIGGATKSAGTNAWNYAKEVATEHPWYTGAALAVGADYLANPPKAPEQPKKTTGATKDTRFTKSLDLYNYVRDRANYQGDLTKYGQKGQGGEQQFFQNERFVPVPIVQQATSPETSAKTGGLIQMKHFAEGGQMQDPRMQGGPQMDPRRAQMMQAMAQQRPAGMGGQQMPRPMPPQGGPQGGLQQGMQQAPRPQMPQRPRDPKMAYYQYGNPPARGMAMGGLSQVHSMKIGGGADGRSDDVNAVLSDGEYVMDAETVAMLGNGSSKAGAAQLDQMRANLRKQKGQALARGQISPNARSPLSYLKGA